MKLTVNTIEFGGDKAVINSYSGLYVSVLGIKSIEEQRKIFADMFPNATVITEEIDELEVMRMVAAGRAKEQPGMYHAHMVGKASEQ